MWFDHNANTLILNLDPCFSRIGMLKGLNYKKAWSETLSKCHLTCASKFPNARCIGCLTYFIHDGGE